ncbi:MAG: hypothetical protein HY900_27975, partial [Deltaproteobacteria bacterium]|nr:hypothetical protein [Deltaproteobacteria bacterium]
MRTSAVVIGALTLLVGCSSGGGSDRPSQSISLNTVAQGMTAPVALA